MRKLVAFTQLTLDGYFADAKSDMSWAHQAAKDPEYDAFVTDNAKGGGTLVFGRITYEMMVGFWPTPQAKQANAVVAERMNEMAKVVFSRTLNEASWSNTKLVKGDIAAEIRRMKDEPGKQMTILGSGSVVSQLARAGLIDEFQVVLNPIALGAGKKLFDGIDKTLNLKLVSSRAFGNGIVVLRYAPAA